MITKSNYTDYFKCNNLYYLKTVLKEEYELSEFQKSLLETGNEVGNLARNYFGDYALVDAASNMEKIAQTNKFIAEGAKTICEASFLYDDLFCQVDILHINEVGEYEIYEVKASSHIQKYHLQDISFQTYILKKLGFSVTKSFLVLLNKSYVRNGELNLKELFKLNLITDFEPVEDTIDKIRNMKNLDSFKPCDECKNCPFKIRCFSSLPNENVYNLAGVRSNELYNNGIITYDEYIEYNKINKKTGVIVKKALEQIEYERNAKGTKVLKNELGLFLDSLVYPLYFLDFETIEETIPQYDGIKCGYIRIVQFSLHIKDTPTSKMRHEEYLLTEKYDNREEVAKLLIKYLNKKGSIIVYSASYERNKIISLRDDLPHLANELENIITRIIDLEKPFDNRIVYKKEMKGYSSIKVVLPAMCKEMEEAYKKLPLVHNGADAITYYKKMIKSTGDKKEYIRKALLDYCCLDTLAMVEILNELYKLMN